MGESRALVVGAERRIVGVTIQPHGGFAGGARHLLRPPEQRNSNALSGAGALGCQTVNVTGIVWRPVAPDAVVCPFQRDGADDSTRCSTRPYDVTDVAVDPVGDDVAKRHWRRERVDAPTSHPLVCLRPDRQNGVNVGWLGETNRHAAGQPPRRRVLHPLNSPPAIQPDLPRTGAVDRWSGGVSQGWWRSFGSGLAGAREHRSC